MFVQGFFGSFDHEGFLPDRNNRPNTMAQIITHRTAKIGVFESGDGIFSVYRKKFIEMFPPSDPM